jgi:dipeptidyl aminopeptidase/acylaminoacyl peptidase
MGVSTEPQVLGYVEKVVRIPDVILVDLGRDDRYALLLSNISGSYQLWSLDLHDGSMREVSHGNERVTYADLSPDSKTVAFTRDFGGSEHHQFFLAPITGGREEVQVLELDGIRVFDFEWSPAGGEIAFTGSTREANFLWSLDVEAKSYRPLFRCEGWVFSSNWSRDSKRLAVSAKTTKEPKSSELVILHREGEEVDVYTPKQGSENSSPKWHPKEERLLFKTDAKGHHDLAIYDHGARTHTYLNLSSLGMDFPNYGWTHDGEGIWFVAARNGRTKLYMLHHNEPPIELPTPTGTISNIKLNHKDCFFIYSWSSLSRPPQIMKLDLTTGQSSELYRPPYDPNIPLGVAEFLSYRSFDGLEIPAYMVFTHGTKEPRPCVVWPHGGPWWEVADAWNPAIQALSVGGFHVFCPNFRGSTGYGAEFERMNIRDPGGGDLQDVVYGARHVLNSGLVDDGKIAIAGASYGGFMTFIAMTKAPEIWKAGAAIVGVTDWKEMYELSDAAFRAFIEELLGKPEENPDLFHDRSPINFVHQIKSPILIWHRANDSRCPLKPVERFAQKLEELGKPYELHVVEDEGHGPQKTDNLVRQYTYVVAFLLKKLS